MQERQTKQKAIIYERLKALDHPTATEVYTSMQKDYPSISRATVFRVLGGLASKGKALEIRVAGTDVRYDYNVEKHYHAHCKDCGRVADVFLNGMEGLGSGAEVMNGFTVDGYTVEFFGRCKACSSASE
jgi:Fe2+ or Zn2+ uptake regulation protein